MYVSKKVEGVDLGVRGREWVTIENFLKCFPEASKEAQDEFKMVMGTMHEEHVEKRIHESLFQELQNRCLFSDNGTSFYTPTVTKDGWVFWTSGHHEDLLKVLAALYIKEDYAEEWEFFDANIGWTISTMDCKTIMVPRQYQPNKEDREIFKFFKVFPMRW